MRELLERIITHPMFYLTAALCIIGLAFVLVARYFAAGIISEDVGGAIIVFVSILLLCVGWR